MDLLVNADIDRAKNNRHTSGGNKKTKFNKKYKKNKSYKKNKKNKIGKFNKKTIKSKRFRGGGSYDKDIKDILADASSSSEGEAEAMDEGHIIGYDALIYNEKHRAIEAMKEAARMKIRQIRSNKHPDTRLVGNEVEDYHKTHNAITIQIKPELEAAEKEVAKAKKLAIIAERAPLLWKKNDDIAKQLENIKERSLNRMTTKQQELSDLEFKLAQLQLENLSNHLDSSRTSYS